MLPPPRGLSTLARHSSLSLAPIRLACEAVNIAFPLPFRLAFSLFAAAGERERERRELLASEALDVGGEEVVVGERRR